MKFWGMPESHRPARTEPLYATATARSATGSAGGKMLAESRMQVYPAEKTRDVELSAQLHCRLSRGSATQCKSAQRATAAVYVSWLPWLPANISLLLRVLLCIADAHAIAQDRRVLEGDD
jgi:hypothetical protein